MSTLEERIAQANTLLAPYAVPHQGLWGRTYESTGDDWRFPFQRDRGRIVQSHAFRRLQGKTQVFTAGEGDHYRTRLTHTMEVALVGRDMARTLQLNEDLAECIALAHDLGHPPFGHSGEEALDEWMQTLGGHFEHNEQSHRIVTLLEEHSADYRGLNLNKEIIDGLLKHSSPSHPEGEGEGIGHTLEAQLVNIADEVAYCAHDTEDGVREGLFTLSMLLDVPIVQEAAELAQTRHTSIRGALLEIFVKDVYACTEHWITESGVRTVDDVLRYPKKLIGFSADLKRKIAVLRTFLWKHMYMHPAIHGRMEEGKHVVTKLCQAYANAPTEKILQFQQKLQCPLPEAVKDYVAGMTDSFAHDSYSALSVAA